MYFQLTTLSDFGLFQLKVDLDECESFINSDPVPDMKRFTLKLIFADLHQLLDLFHKNDWTNYISSRKRLDSKPIRLTKDIVLCIECNAFSFQQI